MKIFVAAFVLFGLLSVILFVTQKDETNNVVIEEPEIKIEVKDPKIEQIGTTVEGRKIETYTYGGGDSLVLFIGGIHGGYEWNSVVLAYEYIDYLNNNPESIPSDVTVVVIPSLNPDGVYKVVQKEGQFAASDAPTLFEEIAPGRFNANDVDLNRNFACNWQPESTWRGETVSAGEAAFSEPEAKALKDYVEKYNPKSVIFWHSEGNAVFASSCNDDPLPETLKVMNVYADGAGYDAVETFDAYAVTGDAEGWLASIGVPAITVELVTHEDVEFEKNLKGIQALLGYYGK